LYPIFDDFLGIDLLTSVRDEKIDNFTPIHKKHDPTFGDFLLITKF
jgi:ribosome-binding protein aMBF1 (putative translation factor)